MDYQVEYDKLIANAQDRGTVDGYSEKHHIIPRSHGGSDDKSNLVELTAQEHFMAHFYLWKIHGDWKMAQAFRMMSDSRSELVDVDSLPEFAEEYAIAKEAFVEGMKNDHELQAKMKASNQRNAQDPEWQANHKAAMQRNAQDPKWQAKHKDAMTKRSQDPTWRANNKASKQRLAQDPTWRANQNDAMQRNAQDPEWQTNVRDGVQKRSKDPKWRASVTHPKLKTMLSLDGEVIALNTVTAKLLKNATEVTLYERQKGLSKKNLDWLLYYRHDIKIIPWEEHQGSWAK